MSTSKKETSVTSPVLFLNVKGEPMRFYIRPGPSKVQLHPLITNGGGVLCRTQEPGAILLADPAEISSAVDGVGQFYISTQYILDCVSHEQQQDIERYRFINLQPVQTRKASQKKPGMGRMSYSHEDDMAILKFIDGHRHDAKGNRIWQQMERQRITSHSWQSMKDRFLKHLQHKQLSKSPRKAKKARPLTESSLSDENTSQTFSPKQKANQKADVVLTSDSDGTQISQGEDEPDHQEGQSSSKRSRSLQCSGPDMIQLHHKDAASHGDKDQDKDQVVLSEKEQEQNEEQAKVSTKRARTDSISGEAALQAVGPNEQSLVSSKRKKGRKTSERKLNILKRAAREFEDSQTMDNESQETQSQSQAFSDDEAQIMAARARALSDPDVNTEKQHAAQGQSERNLRAPEDEGPGPSSTALRMTSNAHLFLFQESQEDLSQPSEENTQNLLEVEKYVARLMQKTNKDLVEVMKALLKASGDTTLALSFLLEEYDPEVHGPIWTKNDDEILLTGDSSERELLVDKYGVKSVSRRVTFLTQDRVYNCIF